MYFLSDLLKSGVLPASQEAFTVAQLPVHYTLFAIIALHIVQGLGGILPFSIVLQSLHSQSCMTSHQCEGANAFLPPGICLY